MRALPLAIAVIGAGLLVGAGYSYVPILWQNQGSTLGVASRVNCSSGLTCSASGGTVTLTAAGGPGSGYATVQEEGTPLAQQTTIDLVGPAITAADDALNSRTKITVIASGTGACAAHKWASTLNDGSAPSCTQPDYSDLTGTPTIPADISGAHYVTTQAEGGLSAEAVVPTCTGTDKLTFNGTSISCATDQTGNASPGGLSGNLQTNNGSGGFGAYGGTSCAYAVKTLDASGASACTSAPTIPTDISGASYITEVAESSLSNEFAMGSLGTGLVKNATSTGVPSIYGGTSCTNQFPRSLDASGAATCASVSLTADVSGILPLANGGTAANLTASNGQAAYSTASALALTTSGTTGQILSFNSGSAPTWIAGPRMVRVSGSNFTTTSTAASTVTGLSWSVTSGTPYYFQCGISASGSATGGPRLLTNLSSTATTVVASVTNHTTVATTLLYTGQTTAAGTLTASCTASCLTGNIPFIVQGMFVPSASETFAIQAANSTSGQTTTVFVGSMCIWWTP